MADPRAVVLVDDVVGVERDVAVGGGGVGVVLVCWSCIGGGVGEWCAGVGSGEVSRLAAATTAATAATAIARCVREYRIHRRSGANTGLPRSNPAIMGPVCRGCSRGSVAAVDSTSAVAAGALEVWGLVSSAQPASWSQHKQTRTACRPAWVR